MIPESCNSHKLLKGDLGAKSRNSGDQGWFRNIDVAKLVTNEYSIISAQSKREIQENKEPPIIPPQLQNNWLKKARIK